MRAFLGASLIVLAACRGPEFTAGAGGDGGMGASPTTGGAPSGGAGGSGGEDPTGGAPTGGGPAGGGGSGPVSVDVEFRDEAGASLAERILLVSDLEGSEVLKTTLDAEGTLTVEVEPGHQISVFEPATVEHTTNYAYGAIVTEATTDIRFIHQRIVEQEPIGDVTVTATCSICSGATKAIYAASCGGTKTVTNPTAPFTSTFYDFAGCPGDPDYDVRVIVYNGSTILAQGSLFDQMGAGTKSVGALSSPAGVTTVDWSITNPPPFALFANRWVYHEGFISQDQVQVLEELGPAGTVALPSNVASPAEYHSRLGGTLGQLVIHIDSVTVAPTSPYTFDASSIGYVNQVQGLRTSVLEPASFDWSLEADGVLGDTILEGILQRRDTGVGDRAVWRIARPPAHSGTMRLPVLLGDLAVYAVVQGSSIDTLIANVEISGVEGYEQHLVESAPALLEGPLRADDLTYAIDRSQFPLGVQAAP